jgi:hypothetical protein
MFNDAPSVRALGRYRSLQFKVGVRAMGNRRISEPIREDEVGEAGRAPTASILARPQSAPLGSRNATVRLDISVKAIEVRAPYYHRQVLQQGTDAAGVPKMYVLYSSRHGAMTDLARIVPPSEVMRIGGHSDIRTAIRYQHSQTANLQAKLDALRTIDKTERVQ